jgi:hypothetical protein
MVEIVEGLYMINGKLSTKRVYKKGKGKKISYNDYKKKQKNDFADKKEVEINGITYRVRRVLTERLIEMISISKPSIIIDVDDLNELVKKQYLNK